MGGDQKNKVSQLNNRLNEYKKLILNKKRLKLILNIQIECKNEKEKIKINLNKIYKIYNELSDKHYWRKFTEIYGNPRAHQSQAMC